MADKIKVGDTVKRKRKRKDRDDREGVVIRFYNDLMANVAWVGGRQSDIAIWSIYKIESAKTARKEAR